MDREKNTTEKKSQKYKYDSQAIAIFSLRSAVVVATVMAIPDAIALIPSVSTVTSWVLKLVACWTTALVAWFVFCLGLLHLMRIIAGGVVISEAGIKLWRLGKLIRWDSIKAVSIEPEYLFTAIFSFEKTVYRLTIYKSIEKGPSFLKLLAVPVYLPSYLFSAKAFELIVSQIYEKKYSIESSPGSWAFLGYRLDEHDSVKRSYRVVAMQRILVSVLIGIGVSIFLVRKACVLYAYNEGIKEYHLHKYADAQKSFTFSTHLDPTFAPAYHGLAGSQFSTGAFDKAYQNWTEALKWKPDYVEAKVSLAYLSLQKRDFDKAEKLLSSALRIDPYNSEALLNRADLDLRKGRLTQAVKFARLVVAREEGRSVKDVFMARCLLAHAWLLEGKVNKAAREIHYLPISTEKLKNGENLTYRLIVGTRIYLALKEYRKALKMAKLALKRAPNVDSYLLMAEVRINTHEYKLARNILKKCRQIMPNNPWIYLLAARINELSGKQDMTYENIRDAVNCRPRDANSLVESAEILERIDREKEARDVINLARQIAPDYPLSDNLLTITEQSQN